MDEQLIEEIVRRVAELPDRDSPDDWPEAMLVTGDELRTIIREALDARSPLDDKLDERLRTVFDDDRVRSNMAQLLTDGSASAGATHTALVERLRGMQRMVNVGITEKLLMREAADALSSAAAAEHTVHARVLDLTARLAFVVGTDTGDTERAARAALVARLTALDLKWAAASLFVWDIIDACALPQPEQEGFVDLPALALQVVGQIEAGRLACFSASGAGQEERERAAFVAAIRRCKRSDGIWVFQFGTGFAEADEGEREAWNAYTAHRPAPLPSQPQPGEPK